jgi:TonB-dependent starch-binding outer membrane protein SusC
MFNLNNKFMKKKPINDPFLIRWIFTKQLLAMKLSFLLCFVGILHASAGLFSQSSNVSLSLKNKSVKEVLREVENHSQYRFLYNDDFLDLDRVLSIDIKNNTVENVLDQIFASANVSYQVLANNLVVITPSEIRQQQRVTGVIRDGMTGETLVGVTVMIQGTTTGVTTDANGRYTIDVPSGDVTLLISYVGYLAESVSVDGRALIDIQLIPDVRFLDEVVVVGYGTMKRSDITGSVVSVSEDKLRASVSTSIDQALQGRAAGVQVFQNSGQPGGGVSIRIRGSNSIHSDNEPLYIVDGVAISGRGQGLAVGFDWSGGGNGQTAVSALATINPSDIVSVEILKDASAAAIYGARGANGVILITTRRGRKGESKVTYEPYFGLQQASKRMNVMNLQDYARFHNEMAAEGWIGAKEEFRDPGLLGSGTDWQSEVFRVAPVTNHQFSVSGGTENTTYALSAGYFMQDGIIIGSNFDRYSMRLNLDNQAKDWLKVGNNLTVSRTNERITLNDSDDGVIAATLLQSPDIPLKFTDDSWGGPLDSQFGPRNPVAMALDRDLTLTRTRILGNIFAEATILRNLTFRSEVGGDIQANNNYAFQPTFVYGRQINDINMSRRRYTQSTYWEVKNYLTYQQTFNRLHNVNLLFGQEASESNWEGLLGQRSAFLTNDIKELNAGDGQTATNEGWRGSNALNSYFTRLFYNYDDRYYITATMRADGSSNFGAENRWGYFPSVALAWRISNERFMENLDVISNLRLRASYGEVGNQNIGGYRYGSALAAVATGMGQAFRLLNIPNPYVKWEATKSTNFGFELGLFDNRIDFMVDVYEKKIDDMLLELPLPNYLGSGHWMGISSPWVNIGQLENRGVEFTLSTRNIAQRNFSWDTDVTFSHNKNKVISLGDEDAVIFQNVQWFHTVTKTMAGYPIGQFYGYVVDGVFTSAEDIANSPKQHNTVDPINGVWLGDLKFKDISGPNGVPDGIIDDHDRTFIGDPNPKFTFGFNNTVTWRNFDMMIYLQGSYGNKIFNFTRRQTEGMNSGLMNQLATVNNRAIIEMIDPNESETDPANFRVVNPNTTMPRATSTNPNNNTRISDRYVEDGSYARIQTVSLGYVLPPQFGAPVGLSRLRVYATVQNLYTFTNYSGYDPEIGAYNQNPMLMGVDNGRYPIPRIFTFGLSAEF